MKIFLFFILMFAFICWLLNEAVRKPKKKKTTSNQIWDAPKNSMPEINVADQAKEIALAKRVQRLLLDNAIIKSDEERKSFKRKKYFFSLAEKQLYEEIRELTQYDILSKVRLIDVIEPIEKHDYKAKAKLIQKHIDFLIMDKKTNEIILAVELDGISHQHTKQAQRDKEKNKIFEVAGIKLLRLKNGQRENLDIIKKELNTVSIEAG